MQDSIIKGRIAEDIVSEMLREAGYFIYRFGYEGILQSLIQKGLPKMRADNITAEKIRSMPDFIVMDKNCDVFFIEVKFRTSQNIDKSFKEWLRKATRYWPEAKLLLVHPSRPNFLISTIYDYNKTGKLYPLEKDKFISVSKELTLRYGELIVEYLM